MSPPASPTVTESVVVSAAPVPLNETVPLFSAIDPALIADPAPNASDPGVDAGRPVELGVPISSGPVTAYRLTKSTNPVSSRLAASPLPLITLYVDPVAPWISTGFMLPGAV